MHTRTTRQAMFFFFSSRRRHTRLQGDWSSDVCSSDLPEVQQAAMAATAAPQTFRLSPLAGLYFWGDATAMFRLSRYGIWQITPVVRRSEERREGKSVDLGGRRIIKKKKRQNKEGDVDR